MAECEKVCRYIDLPLQHASAAVLKRMRRPGNRRTYDGLLARIRDRVPASRCGRPSSSASRARPTRISPSSRRSSPTPGSITSACSPIRTRKAPARSGSPTMCRPAVKKRRRNALMARQKKIVARAHRARIGSRGERADGRPLGRARDGGAGPARRPGARTSTRSSTSPTATRQHSNAATSSGPNRRRPRLRPGRRAGRVRPTENRKRGPRGSDRCRLRPELAPSAVLY